jgi:putative ABC transport system substrate-binding protein
MEVSSAGDLEDAFKSAKKANSKALASLGSASFYSYQKQLTEFAAKNHLPAMYTQTEFVASGGLMSYAADEGEAYRRMAVLLDKILKGAIPAELPVEQPTKFELAINLKAAKQISVTIPQSVLYGADKVIK